MADLIYFQEYFADFWPPRRPTRDNVSVSSVFLGWCTGQRIQDVIQRIRRRKNSHIQTRSDRQTREEMVSGRMRVSTATRSRTARQPAHFPPKETTSLILAHRDEQNGVDAKNTTAGTQQHRREGRSTH